MDKVLVSEWNGNSLAIQGVILIDLTQDSLDNQRNTWSPSLKSQILNSMHCNWLNCLKLSKQKLSNPLKT